MNRFTAIAERFHSDRDLKDAGLSLLTASHAQSHYLQLFRDAHGREILPPNDWAARYRVMGDDNIRYTRWQPLLTPYLRDIADSMASVKPTERVVVIGKPVQVGATEASLNEVLRRIHQEPCTVLAFMDTKDKMDRFIRTRWDPALRQEPFLTMQIAPHGLSRYFPGGAVHFNGAQSATGMSSSTASLVIGDEVSAYRENIGGEGDFLTLARGRVSTAEEFGKIILFSKFVGKGTSSASFWGYFCAGDMREYLVPCAGCGEFWLWTIETLGKDDDGCYMACDKCGHKTRDGDERVAAVQQGRWEPTKKREAEDVTSYRISGFIAPPKWKPWSQAYDQYRLARRTGSVDGGLGSLGSFYNNWLGLPYEENEGIRQATPSEARKKLNTWRYKSGEVPDPVSVVTLAIDVQTTHLEWEVKGWDTGLTCWSLDRGRIDLPVSMVPRCVEAIREIMARRYGGLRIWLGAIDTGGRSPETGGFSPHVLKICSYFPTGLQSAQGRSGGLVPVKGTTASPTRPELVKYRPGEKTRGGQRRSGLTYGLGVDVGKLELYGTLMKDYDLGDVAGLVFAPTDYPDSYFAEIRAETMTVDRRADKVKIVFTKPDSRAANEALDLHVYNRACLEILNIPGSAPERLDRITRSASKVRNVRLLDGAAKTKETKNQPAGEKPPSRASRRRAGTTADTPRRRRRA